MAKKMNPKRKEITSNEKLQNKTNINCEIGVNVRTTAILYK